MMPLDVQLHPSGTITYREPIDQTVAAATSEDVSRLQLQAWFARLVMGEDRRRHELLAAIAALDPAGYRFVVEWLLSGACLARRDHVALSTPDTEGLRRVAEAAEAWLLEADADF